MLFYARQVKKYPAGFPCGKPAGSRLSKKPRRVCARRRKQSSKHFCRRHVRRQKYFSARKRASVSECAAASRSLFKREPSEAGLVGKRVKNPFLTRSIRPFSLRETCRINAYGKSAGVYRRYFRICTALLAAPLRIWSPQHQSVRALFCVRSSRTRPTQTRSCPLVSSGVG